MRYRFNLAKHKKALVVRRRADLADGTRQRDTREKNPFYK